MVPTNKSSSSTELLYRLPQSDVDFDVVAKKGYDYFKIMGNSKLVQNKKQLKLALMKLRELALNIKKKYEKREFIRTVILIVGDDLFDSQVIAFFDEDVYRDWFMRSSRYQTWRKTKKKNLLIDKLKLNEYRALKEIHYTEKIYDPDLDPPQQRHDLWFYEEP